MSELLLVNRPVVAGTARRTPVAAVGSTLAMVGLGVFFWLSSARAAQEERASTLPPLTTAASEAAPAPDTANTPPQGAGAPPPSAFAAGGAPVTLQPTNLAHPSAFATPVMTAPVDPMRERMRAPTLVVDLAQASMPSSPGSARTIDDHGNAVAAPISGGDHNLSDTESFAARVGGEGVDVAQARRMTGLDRLVPQGAVIGAVMETALNSDQPGFARAITQRDVYSFDGSAILVPAGSRVIGQYKSGVAQGASRLFVLWTRLIRPDGVSIELASPATDELGRGGVGGKVNRHFLQRYGGAILTSVLSGGITALAASRSGGSTIIVGSAAQASNLASQAGQVKDIPPTITTRQGAAVRIFVARDLDFSKVGPAR